MSLPLERSSEAPAEALDRVANDNARDGALRPRAPIVSVPEAAPANDDGATIEAWLQADDEFIARCDAQREAWVESHEDQDFFASIANPSESTVDEDDECSKGVSHERA